MHQLEPESVAYSMPGTIRLWGALDIEALSRAFDALGRRHETLRTSFRVVDGLPEQVIAPEPSVSPEVIDLRQLPENEREDEVVRLTEAEARRPFDLKQGPLFRVSLYRLGEEEHVLHVNMHHMISDYWSFGVINREFVALYSALAAGTLPQLAELPVQYADFAYCQRQWLQGEVLEAHLAYWKEKLGGELATLELPTDRPRPAVQTHRGANCSLGVSKALVEGLRRLSRGKGVSFFMVLLAAFKVLLHRHSGQEDIIVGTPIAGRNRTELEGLIGFFINTIVMRTDLSGNPGFDELIERVRDTAFGAYAHQEMPFEKLVEELAPERDLSRTPIFQVFFNHIREDEMRLALPGLEVEVLGGIEYESKFDLTLYVWEQTDAIRLTALYNADLFDEQRIETMLSQYESLLAQVADNSDEKITRYSLHTSIEKKLLPTPVEPLAQRWSGAVHARFSEQARKAPQQTAVVDAWGSWSYGELEHCSNQLANKLKAAGIKSGEIVAVYGHRSAGLVLSLLGILKAGAAILILDPDYPAARLVMMLQAAGPSGVLFSEATEELVSFAEDFGLKCHLRIPLSKEATRDYLKGSSPDPIAGATAADDTAYLVFTSGTTGEPKGIVGTHGPLSHFIAWHCKEFGFNGSDRFSMLSGLSHDPLLRDIFTPLWLGATLCIPEPDEIFDPKRFRSWMRTQHISVAHMTPALGQILTEMDGDANLSGGTLPELGHVFFGGDTLTQRHVQRLQRIAPGAECVNFYGTTETPQAMGYHVADSQGAADKNPAQIPLGRGIDGVQLLVLNRAGRLAGIGELGEIHVRTPYLVKGYLKDEELTGKRFVVNPFSGESSDRLYKTGDLGRYLPDGCVVFYGRSDRQVSIRGFRVEIGEIEAQMSEMEGIEDVFVELWAEVGDNSHLVAYYVTKKGSEISIDILRNDLALKLPNYMLPLYYMELESIPLTPNGKVDRKALPEPDFDRLFKNEYLAPRSELEKLIAKIWQEVLNREKVGIHDNFFEMGGHSLLAVQMVSRIRQALGVELPLRSLFENPTVAGLAAAIEQEKGMTAVVYLPKVVPISREERLPLSFAQERLWFLHQLEPESVAYSMPGTIRLWGALDIEALSRAFDALGRRHETLRTSFRVVDGLPEQVIAPEPSVSPEVIDLRQLPENEREDEVVRLTEAEARRPFDLKQGPLFRVSLYRLGEEEHVLHVNMHHMISDYWSFGVINREFVALYSALAAGTLPQLAELPVQYADFAYCQRQWLQGEVLEAHLAYWKEKLGGELATLELPTDRPRPAVQTHRGANCSLGVSKALVERLRRLSRGKGVSFFMVLLAAFKVLLHRHSGQEDIIVGTPIAGRNRTELEGLIGFFINTIVMRTDLSGNPGFDELIERVRDTAFGAYAHQEMPFEKLVEELAPERDLSRTPIFQVFFNHIREDEMRLALPGLEVEVLGGIEYESKFDLTLYVWEQTDAIRLTALYNADLFDEQRIETMLSQYESLLAQVADNSDEKITRYSLHTSIEKKLLPTPVEPLAQRWSGAVHARFSEQARKAPQQTAVVDAWGSWSYGELEHCSNQLANKLKAAGIKSGEIVAVYGHRSAGLVLSLLGILKAGAAILILDPDYPAARLVMMLQAAGPSGVLFSEATEELVSFAEDFGLKCHLRIPLSKEATRDYLKGSSPDPIAGATAADDTAYLVFTSGTTGEPKGIVGTHGPLSHFIAWHCKEFGFNGSDRFSMLSGLSHDPLLRDIFTPLWLGATLCIPEPDEIFDPKRFRSWMRTQHISVAHMTPALGQILTEMDGDANLSGGTLPELGHVFFGGDTLTQRHVQRLQRIAPGAECVNFYGTTETPQAMGYHVADSQGAADKNPAQIPLGRGIDGVQLLVLNRAGRLAGIGELGEIHVRTPYLVKGYLKDEELTGKRFVVNPFSGESSDRLYKTGDLGRYLPDGCVVFYGRSDRQVSIRGFRVEIGEIEAQMSEMEGIEDVFVELWAEVGDNSHLVAYYVTKKGSEISIDILRNDLALKLPNYMLPLYYMELESIPLTPNGKVDRKALPEPDFDRLFKNEYLAPRSELEKLIAKIWQEVLTMETIGIRDDFFELGGHSLLLTRVMSQLNQLLNIAIPMRTFFEERTVEALANFIEIALWSSNERNKVAMSKLDDREVFEI